MDNVNRKRSTYRSTDAFRFIVRMLHDYGIRVTGSVAYRNWNKYCFILMIILLHEKWIFSCAFLSPWYPSDGSPYLSWVPDWCISFFNHTAIQCAWLHWCQKLWRFVVWKFALISLWRVTAVNARCYWMQYQMISTDTIQVFSPDICSILYLFHTVASYSSGICSGQLLLKITSTCLLFSIACLLTELFPI